MNVSPIPNQAVCWEDIQNAIAEWACGATGLTWVWADQKAPQPPYPYGLLNVIAGLTKIGGLDEQRVVENGDETELIHTGPREFTVSFQVQVGLPEADEDARVFAENYLATLMATTSFESAKVIFRRANISVVEELPIQSLDLVIATETVSRASMDIRFQTQSALREVIVPLEQVQIQSGSFLPSGQSLDGNEFDFGG